MFLPEEQLRIWLCLEPTDMRCSFDGLAARVRLRLQDDPLSGQLFVFVNRRRSHAKMLFFDRNGYCLWAKRLERGQFDVPFGDGVKKPLSLMALRMLIDGLVPRAFAQRRRYARGHP
jgi:transposase